MFHVLRRAPIRFKKGRMKAENDLERFPGALHSLSTLPNPIRLTFNSARRSTHVTQLHVSPIRLPVFDPGGPQAALFGFRVRRFCFWS